MSDDNEALRGLLAEARGHVAALREELSDQELRRTALHYAAASHGEAAGAESDGCFVARARVFETYLRSPVEVDVDKLNELLPDVPLSTLQKVGRALGVTLSFDVEVRDGE